MTLFKLELPISVPHGAIVCSDIPLSTVLEHSFPSGVLSRIGENESWRKEVHRPATSTHKWWAKRLGSVFRGILVSAVSAESEDAMSLYESACRFNGITVFDPFAGSGTTVVESAKLGARVIGYDINPVATLVQRQAVQQWDIAELKRAYRIVEASCRPEIERVHQTRTGETVLYYFWVALATCPNASCGVDVRLFSNHVFSKNAYPKRVPDAQIVCPICLDVIAGRYDFTSVICRNGHQVTPEGAVSRATMTCTNCGTSARILDALRGRSPRFEMYAKLVLDHHGKKRYESIDDYDVALYDECTRLLEKNAADLTLPSGWLEDGQNTRQALRWGFTEWRQFFNDRQLYSLGLLATALRDLDAGLAEREALITLFSGTLEFNNMFCSFKGEGTGAVRHMFSHHILKPERMPLEAHPWGTPASSGSFSTLFKSRLIRAHQYKVAPVDQVLRGDRVERVDNLSLPIGSTIVDAWPPDGLPDGQVYLRTGDSSNTDLPSGIVDLVVTDPPYMDNVHYSELADFFYAWLWKLEPHSGCSRSESGSREATDLFTTRSGDEVQSASPDEFEAAITRVWKECHRVLKSNGLLAFTFHQARLPGWLALTRALANAGFVVTAVQPVKGEMITSVTKGGAEPSNLDAIVVCRKRTTIADSAAFTDPHAAADEGEARLVELRASGVSVGAGDIRSVIRGYVLATYTTDPAREDIHRVAKLADELASEKIAKLSVGLAKPAERA